MSGWWLVSFLGLWIIVIALCVLVVGMLQQISLLQQQKRRPTGLEEQVEDILEPLETDGPQIGAFLPNLGGETINGYEAIEKDSLRSDQGTLLMLMSPTCDGCQHAVGPLNELVDSGVFKGKTVVLLRGNKVTCKAFLDLFPLHVPVLCDSDGRVTQNLSAHRNPLGLLYDSKGSLVRKGVVHEYAHFLALLGDSEAERHAEVFPPNAASLNAH